MAVATYSSRPQPMATASMARPRGESGTKSPKPSEVTLVSASHSAFENESRLWLALRSAICIPKAKMGSR